MSRPVFRAWHRVCQRCVIAVVALVLMAALAACQQKEAAAAAVAPPSFASLTPEELAERNLHRRAFAAAVWAVPAVNYERMYQALVHDARAGEGGNKIVYWSKLFGWKNQTLTPNPDTVYLMPFIDTREGPVVLEIPAQGEGTIVGSVDDVWQAAMEDVGPAGADKGKGGRYLILPPGYSEPLPGGYIVLRSPTLQSYALLRSNPASGSDDDVAKAVAYGRKIKLYPLAQAAKPPDTVFVDALDVVFDATIPYDIRFFESLDRIIQAEPWLTRDKAMIDVLRTVGIEKGKPFAPDDKTKAVLEDALREAHAWMNARYEAYFSPPFYAGTHWGLPVDQTLIKEVGNGFADADIYPTDARGITYTFGFFSARHLGAGQFYLLNIVDKDGKPLDGGKRYRLSVPANAPVHQYWSITAYDRDTHALIRDTERSSRSSLSPGLQKNADGSVDVYFGPTAPSGKDANWVPTKAGRPFELLARFYGPDQSFFDKTWQLADVALVP